MTAPSPKALDILRRAVGANIPRHRGSRGARNTWTASDTDPSAALCELVDAGLMVAGERIRPGTIDYRATHEGMRKAGLSPSEIERCHAVTQGQRA